MHCSLTTYTTPTSRNLLIPLPAPLNRDRDSMPVPVPIRHLRVRMPTPVDQPPIPIDPPRLHPRRHRRQLGMLLLLLLLLDRTGVQRRVRLLRGGSRRDLRVRVLGRPLDGMRDHVGLAVLRRIGRVDSGVVVRARMLGMHGGLRMRVRVLLGRVGMDDVTGGRREGMRGRRRRRGVDLTVAGSVSDVRVTVDLGSIYILRVRVLDDGDGRGGRRGAIADGLRVGVLGDGVARYRGYVVLEIVLGWRGWRELARLEGGRGRGGDLIGEEGGRVQVRVLGMH